MSAVDTDAWTCPHPDCGETVRGGRRQRRHEQGAHARRHGTGRQPSAARPAPADLVIPAAPRDRGRVR